MPHAAYSMPHAIYPNVYAMSPAVPYPMMINKTKAHSVTIGIDSEQNSPRPQGSILPTLGNFL